MTRRRARRIRLLHWNAEAGEERAALLEGLGCAVRAETPEGLRFLVGLGADPPDAVLIDLDRRPSHGRETALAIRQRARTRRIPIVFAGGEAEKVARVRERLPDAVFTSWGRVGAAIERAIAHPPAEPVAPRTLMDAYSGRPLVKKLGLKPADKVLLAGAPPGFQKTLTPLPEGVRFGRGLGGRGELILWFVRSRRELEPRVATLARRADFRALWILWPKKSSGVASDLSETVVRAAGLASGLVDYKISAIDETWSGLCFARRGARR